MPSDLSLCETVSLMPATSMDEMVAAERSWCDVLTMTTSDMSGFSWSSQCGPRYMGLTEQREDVDFICKPTSLPKSHGIYMNLTSNKVRGFLATRTISCILIVPDGLSWQCGLCRDNQQHILVPVSHRAYGLYGQARTVNAYVTPKSAPDTVSYGQCIRSLRSARTVTHGRPYSLYGRPYGLYGRSYGLNG